MSTVHDAIDAAINEATTARLRVNKLKSKQVRGVDDVATLKATAQTWFHTHRPIVASGAPHVDLSPIDEKYTELLNSTAKYAAKATYLDVLKLARAQLIIARAAALVPLSAGPVANTDDLAPDFSPL